MKKLLFISYLPFPFIIVLSSCFGIKYFYLSILLYIIGISSQIGRGSIYSCISSTLISIIVSLFLGMAVFQEEPWINISTLTGIPVDMQGGGYGEYSTQILCKASLFLNGLVLFSIYFNNYRK